METTTIHATSTTSTSGTARRAAIHGLAVVGFIVLIILGMALAIYAASFVPKAAGKLSSAAVYFASVFAPATATSTLEVVTPGTTVEFPPVATTTAPVAATSTAPVTTTKPATGTSAGVKTSTSYAIGSGPATTPANLYGLSNLVVTVTATGYLATDSTDSFVKAATIPSGSRVAVKFAITNIGTNASGTFSFIAKIPTKSSYTFNSPVQQSLLPGEHIDYVLGFDQAKKGTDETITITADSNNNVVESDEHNSVDATVTVN